MSAPKKPKAVAPVANAKPKRPSNGLKPTPKESISEEYVIDSDSEDEDEDDSDSDEDKGSKEPSSIPATKGVSVAAKFLKLEHIVSAPGPKKTLNESSQSQHVQSSNGAPKVNGDNAITISSDESEEDSNNTSEEDEDSEESSEESAEEQKSVAVESSKPGGTIKSLESSQPLTAKRQSLMASLSNGKTKTNGNATIGKVDSASGSSDSVSSESDDDTEGETEGETDDEEEEDGAIEEVHISNSESEESSDESSQPTPIPQARTPIDLHPRPYNPPPGFADVRISSGAQASRAFSKEGLAGKMLWHITAPASVPIDQIKEASIESIAKQEIVLRYDGKDYELARYDGVQNPTLLLPSEAEDGYRIEPTRFMQSLHLQQKLRYPNTEEPIASSARYQNLKKSVRPQPKGLKMRYKPFGLEYGKPEAMDANFSDTEGQDLHLSKNPLVSTAHRKPDDGSYRNYAISASKQISSTESKKKKKRKRDQKPYSKGEGVSDFEVVAKDSSPSTLELKKKKKKHEGSSHLQSSQEVVLNGTPSKTSFQSSQDSVDGKKRKKSEMEKEVRHHKHKGL